MNNAHHYKFWLEWFKSKKFNIDVRPEERCFISDAFRSGLYCDKFDSQRYCIGIHMIAAVICNRRNDHVLREFGICMADKNNTSPYFLLTAEEILHIIDLAGNFMDELDNHIKNKQVHSTEL